MSIDPLTENILTFAAAARRVPPVRAGRPRSPATIWRWCAIGIVARNGQRVKLEVAKIGGATVTSEQALSRFFARLNGEELVTPAAPASRSHVQSEASLDAAGI